MNVKIIGYPGVGKTTYMNTLVTGLVDDETPPDNILYTSFSRAAARSIREKLAQTHKWVDKLSEQEFRNTFPYFGTTHSISARLLKLKEENYVTDKIKSAWCEQNDLPYTRNKKNKEEEDNDDVPLDIPDNIGNLALEYFQTIKRLGYIHDNAVEGINDRIGMNWKTEKTLPDYIKDNLVNLFYDWEDFRQTKEVYEYEDMFEEIILDEISPTVEYMFIDEAHDCYPLQKMVYDTWKEAGNINNVYVALDPNQTIYTYLGCSPHLFDDYFINTEPHVLPKSWRLPEQILNEVKHIAKQLGDADINQVEPNGEKGEVNQIYNYEVENLLHDVNGTVFVLFRFNEDIRKFIHRNKNLIIDLKVRGMGRTRTSWNYPTIINLCNFKHCWIHDTDDFNYSEVKEFITRTPSTHLNHGAKTEIKKAMSNRVKQGKLSGKKVTSMFSRSEIISYFKGRDIDIATIIDDNKFRVTPAQREILIKHDELITTGSFNIELGTIHSSKGLEADNVFFHNWKMTDWMSKTNELRVEYVGKSRAHKRLFIIN